MARKTILWNGGLVTSRDPSLLSETNRLGELTRADNAEYLPDDPFGIWPTMVASAFNATAESGPIKGGGFFEFEQPTTRKIITMVGTTYRIADMGTSGTFSDLVTGLDGSAERFDQASLRNEHIIFNGVDRNRVVKDDLTTSIQGMLANTTVPTAVVSTDPPGTISLSSGSTLTYWVEERVKDAAGNILRRNAASAATVVTVTGPLTNATIAIQRPAIVNADATHWALFATETNGEFPTGAEISDVGIATTLIIDTRTGTDPLLPSGDTYPTIAVELFGVTSTVPKYGEAPISSTGDVFEGSVVQNDVANESHVRFTFPDEIHASPALNVINIRTKWKDRVVWIRTLGRAIIVGMEHGLWRIDTLPLPEDAGFQPDRVKTEIDGAFGSVSPLGVAKFSFGQGELLAYVSPFGIITTDGAGWDVLTSDLDWKEVLPIGVLASAILVNNPRQYRLELYIDESTAYYFHYHPTHVKGGLRAKVTGPIDTSARCAFVGHIDEEGGDMWTFVGGHDGILRREGAGSTTGDFVVRSGDLYLNGIGGEATVRREYVHHSAGAMGQLATLREIMQAEGEDATVVTETFDVSRREATGVYLEGLADAFQFGIEMSGAATKVRFDYMELDYDTSVGEEQSP